MKNCFVISPIGPEDSDIRRNADQLFSYIIKPSVEQFGYRPLRADMIPVPGMISPEVIKHIIEDDLAVADLTGMNPNVFYELAIRHVIGKPYIHLIKEGESIPFDVKDVNTIPYSMHIASVEKAKSKIVELIRMYEDGSEVISPFTVTMDILSSQKANTSDKLDELKSKLDSLNKLITGLTVTQQQDEVTSAVIGLSSKIEYLERQMTNSFPEILEKGISRITKTLESTSSKSSSSSEQKQNDPSKESDDKQETPKRYIPPGLAKRATPNTWTVREYLEKFAGKFDQKSKEF